MSLWIDKKYLKLYRVESDLVNYEDSILKNTISFDHFDNEENLSVALDASIFRNLTDKYDDWLNYHYLKA